MDGVIGLILKLFQIFEPEKIFKSSKTEFLLITLKNKSRDFLIFTRPCQKRVSYRNLRFVKAKLVFVLSLMRLRAASSVKVLRGAESIFLHPRVVQQLLRRDSASRVPVKTSFNDIYKSCISSFQNIFNVLTARFASLPPRVRQVLRHVFRVKKLGSPCGLFHDRFGRKSEYFHDANNLLSFTFPREHRVASVQFDQNASKTPHINSSRIRDAEYNLRSSIKP